MLLLALGVVLIMMREVRKPDRWQWVAQLDRQVARSDKAGEEAGSPIPGPASESDDRKLLSGIRDDTYFRSEEHPAWFQILGRLKRDSESELARQSLGAVTYRQLDRQPEVYRGRLVTLRGIARLVARKEAPKNEQNINDYFQVWVQPNDEPSSLLVIYCLNLPPGFPQGPEIDASVEVNGVFFKRWAYRAQDTVRTAPLLLAKTLAWNRELPASAEVEAEPVALAWWIVATLAAAALVVWLLVRRTRVDSRLAEYLESAPGPNEPILPPDYEPGETISSGDLNTIDLESDR
jgi:hypothetical protein